MSGTHGLYTDRFGNDWVVRHRRGRGGTGDTMTFTCGAVELVATDGTAARQRGHTDAELKDLFCEAERPLAHNGQQWFVGYRTRMGRGGRMQGGLHTRFRSATGEVRFAQEMLPFRQMPAKLLCEHLAAARPAGRMPSGARP